MLFPISMLNLILVLKSKININKNINVLILILIIIISILSQSYYIKRHNFNNNLLKYYEQINYFNLHNENLYIVDTATYIYRYDQSTKLVKYPKNINTYGDSTYGSDLYKKRFSIYGLSEINSNVLFKDNVYFATYEKISDDNLQLDYHELNSSELFYNYLKKYCNANNYELVDSLDKIDLYIYKFY